MTHEVWLRTLECLLEDMTEMSEEQRQELIGSLPWCRYCMSDYSVGRICQCENDE